MQHAGAGAGAGAGENFFSKTYSQTHWQPF